MTPNRWVVGAVGVVCLVFGGEGCSTFDMSGPLDWNREVTPPDDEVAAETRSSCGYAAGALPAETQGASTPRGDEIPIDHLIVIMKENRSFDHYFQGAAASGLSLEVAPPGFTNPDARGQPVAPFHDTSYCFVDPVHSWNAIHRQINGGAMDGFVVANEGQGTQPPGGTASMLSGRRAMGYYEGSDVPFMYWAARNFAVGERYFSSVPGPTWPNRMYLYAASSFGETDNEVPHDVKHTIFSYLATRDVSWKVYYSTVPAFSMFVDHYLLYAIDHTAPISEFFTDLEQGKLPQVVFLDPELGTESYRSTDEHPPADMQVGQQWTASVVDAVMRSTSWSRSLIFLTYDQHGGLYDHVAPPKACPPDDRATKSTPEYPQATFDMYGVRVPFIIISPFAKRGYVSQKVYDHTSILRFIETRFVIPALSARDANAEVPWDMLDLDGAPNLEPPPVPVVPVDEGRLAACKAIFKR